MSADLLRALSDAGASHVLGPADADYHRELQAFNLATRLAPDAVVAARSASDVTATIEVARRLRSPLAILGLGHGQMRDITSGIAISTRKLATVEVDAADRAARIGAGTTWSEVLEATTPHGLAALSGSAPGVGVIGYLLGGGLGPVARTYGFAADHVRSIEIVTPAAGFLTVTSESHPDLFWALRGGKGGFGVVTAVTIDLFPIQEFYGGGLYFAAEHARAALTAFADWAPSLPESVTASVAMLRLPPEPALPEPIRGRLVVHVRFAALEEPADAEVLLAPIRSLAEPLLETIGIHPYAQIGLVHADPVLPMPVVDGAVTLARFDSDVIDALLAAAGPEVDVPLSAVEIRGLGGAVSREPEIANAVGGRDAAFSLFVVSAPIPHLVDTVLPQVVKGVLAAVEPWRAPVRLINFVGRGNDADGIVQSWTPEQNDRLDAVRATADPDALFPFARHGEPTPQ